MKKILFCGGGTAGHVMPNLALIERLIGKADIYYLGTGGMEKQLVRPYMAKGVVYGEFSAVKFERKLSPSLVTLPFKLASSVSECKKRLKEIKPDLVVSKGGFGGLPVVIAAHRLKIPAVAHESDFSLGLANKLSLPFVEKMFTVYENAALEGGKKSIVCTPPMRESVLKGNRAKMLEECGFSGKKPVLAVLGGSLGAKRLNETLLKALPLLLDSFDVIAVTGKNKSLDFTAKGFYQTEFCNTMGDLYAMADIALSRSGSNTVSELMANRIPALFVPLSKASRGEQVKNARFHEKNGCCKVLDEDELSPEKVILLLKELLAQKNAFKEQIKRHTKADDIMWNYISERLTS